MARDVVDLTPIESRDELVAWFAEGAKPKAQWRAGTEHEKFAFMIWSDLPTPAEASLHDVGPRLGFAQAGNQYPLFGIMP